MKEEEKYMQRCLDLAEIGRAEAHPNPSVGCLILYDGKVIGEGYTSPYGGNHAEVNAVQAVLSTYGSQEAKRLLAASEVYVSLEPCAHHGKTPPCADLLVEYKPGKVIIGCLDPSEKVSGKGVERLQRAGIPCEIGVLGEKAKWSVRRFMTQVTKSRPYVILKWAETADGYFGSSDLQQKWISNPATKQWVHKWRSEEDAILVGKNTALIDNPSLTVREWSGKNPLRVLVDKHLEVPLEYKIFDSSAETLVFNAERFDLKKNVRFIELENFDLYLPQNILYQLYLLDVQSLIVEGGAKMLQSFINAGMWDEARVFSTPEKWGEGIKAPEIRGEVIEENQIADNTLTVMKNSAFDS